MNILFVGDIVGKIGRKSLSKSLSFVIKNENIDFTIVNGENVTHGKGLIVKHYKELMELPINCITLGNHYKDKLQIIDFIDNDNIVRPLNIINEFPGEGSRVFNFKNKKIRVTNVLGTAYMKEEVKDPYESIMEIVKHDTSNIHIIDFHAEATGEKKALAYALSKNVKAILGTHTHVQTTDNQILNNNCFYISDVGMCGSFNSILGNEINSVVDKIIFKDSKSKFKILDDDDLLFNAVVLSYNDNDEPVKIKRINLLNGRNYE